MSKDKWEYMKPSLYGWRPDIHIQLLDIGLQNIRKIKGRRVGYKDEEYFAMLHSGQQIELGRREKA